LCDGKYYHEISLDGENIFIQISKYKRNTPKKINLKYFTEKRIELYLHQLDWQAFDLELNTKELYQLKSKFEHELHFLIFDNKKKSKKKSNKSLLEINPNDRMSKNSMSTIMSSLDVRANIPRTSTNNSLFEEKNIGHSGHLKSISAEKKEENKEESFNDKFIALIKVVDELLAKNTFSTYKLFENIKIGSYFSSFSEESLLNKYKKYCFIYFKQYNFDWILFEHSPIFEERTPFYFSLKWLTCQSCFVHGFLRDIGRKIKQNSFKLLKIPYFDSKGLQIFKKSLEWEIRPLYLLPIFIKIIKNDKCFKHCWFFNQEEDYIILSDECNLFIKITHINVNYILNQGRILLIEENYDPEIVMTQTSNINKFWEYAQSIDVYIKVFSVFNNFSEELDKK